MLFGDFRHREQRRELAKLLQKSDYSVKLAWEMRVCELLNSEVDLVLGYFSPSLLFSLLQNKSRGWPGGLFEL